MRKGWQTLDNVQRKFLQFITFIKLKTPFIKKEDSSGEFHIFTHTPKCKYCNLLLKKEESDVNKKNHRNRMISKCLFSAVLLDENGAVK